MASRILDTDVFRVRISVGPPRGTRIGAAPNWSHDLNGCERGSKVLVFGLLAVGRLTRCMQVRILSSRH